MFPAINSICFRGDHIVPNMNDAFPHLKKKPEVSESLDLLYYAL